MANYKLLIPFIQGWEGGEANDPNDRGKFTKNGVTIATWRIHGWDNDGDGDKDENDLRLITYAQWESIFKRVYWDVMKGDQIKSQAVANQLVDFFWGSGYWAVRKLQEVLRYKFGRDEIEVDGKFGKYTLAATNAVPEKDLFEALTEARIKFLEKVIEEDPTQEKWRNGWMNRVRDLYKKNIGLIKTAAFSYVGLILVTSLAIGTIALINHYSKKEKQITNGTTV